MKTVYYLIITSFLISACVQKPQVDPQQVTRLDLLEQRIFSLENQRLRAIADLRDRTEAFRVRVDKELKNFQKSQRFFIQELDQLKNDITFVTNDNELAQSRSRKNQLRLTQLTRKLGNQVIALNELKTFFNESIDLNNDKGSQDVVAYNAAFKMYRSKRFNEARDAFTKFRKDFAESLLVDDAVYLIAYMEFLKGDYDQSALKFHEMIEQFPESNKLNDAKWWLGVSFERTGDINAAIDNYRLLLELAPENPIRVKAELRLEEVSTGQNP